MVTCARQVLIITDSVRNSDIVTICVLSNSAAICDLERPLKVTYAILDLLMAKI